jgi:hypothetical protein
MGKIWTDELQARKAGFPLGAILRAQRKFSLSFLIISSTREITRQRKNPLRAQNSA